MDFRKPLSQEKLYHRCDLSQLNFETTAELKPLSAVVGQERAISAIDFAINMAHDGYNLFLLGPSGTGKHHLLRQYIDPVAKALDEPEDWVYLYNFDDPQHPICISLPHGVGAKLRVDVKHFCENLFHSLRSAFLSEVYTAQEKHIDSNYRKRENDAFLAIERDARASAVAFLRTDTGFAFAPLKEGKIIEPHEFAQFSPKEQDTYNKVVDDLQERLEALLQNIPIWQQETRQEHKELASKAARLAVSYLIDNLKDAYRQHTHLLDHFDRIEQDVVDNVELFRRADIIEAGINDSLDMQKFPQLRHYQINLFIDHNNVQGAPVIYADNPTHDNLIGKTEYLAHMGTLVTDFKLIRPGLLHQANGGFLIIDAHKLLKEPYSWDALKRALSAGEVVIESLSQSLGFNSTVSLEPEPIPLKTKVILVGERFLYYALSQYDPDFEKLFKIAADMEDEIPRDSDSSLQIARLIAAQVIEQKLLPFDNTAVARVIEHASRLVEHAHKVSIHMGEIIDLLVEANFWALQQKRLSVHSKDVQKAIDQKRYRHGRIEKELQEHILEGNTLIDTEGKACGQINGLSIVSYGNQMYGMPSRITATARPGDGKLIDIEHESDLGGDIHTKGVLILSHFMSARYATHKAFSVSASIGFEQSYGGVDGDSASAAELCALLSAICDIPIKQNLAVTGSINQHGIIQVIGGVNEKIEGFFDICVARGLNGEHGVVIPANNVQHLMLEQRVIDAVEEGKFHIYAVNHIDEVLELFTDIPAGERNDDDEFPEGSFNFAVEEALVEMAEQVHEDDDDDDGDDAKNSETAKKDEKKDDNNNEQGSEDK